MSEYARNLTSQPKLSRRLFLAASGLTVAGGTLAPLFGPRTATAHDEECSCLTAWGGVWSAARVGGRYYALAGEVDSGTVEIHELTVGRDGQVSLGEHHPLDLPAGLVPATLYGNAKRLLLGGAAVTEVERLKVDYTVNPLAMESEYLIGYSPPFSHGVVDVPLTTLRPALFEVDGRKLREIPIDNAVEHVGWGIVTDIAGTADAGIVLRIEGSTSYEEAYCERVVVTETRDGGVSWFTDTVAAGLGEGWRGALAVTNNTVVTMAVDQHERRTLLQRSAGAGGEWLATDVDGSGAVLGAVSGARGELVLFVADDGQIRRRTFSTASRRWSGGAAAAPGEPVHAVLTIGGSATEWIAISRDTAHIFDELG
jgi:hypothetical protein